MDQIPLTKVVDPKTPLQLWGSQKLVRSSKYGGNWPMNLVQRRCARAFSRLQSKPPQSPVPCRHMADEHRRAFLPARTPACCVSSHRILLQLEPEPLSPCPETTRAAGKAIGRRLCPSTRPFAASSTSPRLCPALECPARLGCSRP